MFRRTVSALAAFAVVVALVVAPAAAQLSDEPEVFSEDIPAAPPPVDYRALVLAAVDDIENLARADFGIAPRASRQAADTTGGSLLASQVALAAATSDLTAAVEDAVLAVSDAEGALVSEEELANASDRVVRSEQAAAAADDLAAEMVTHRVSLALSAYMGVQTEGLADPVMATTPSVALMASVADGWLLGEVGRAEADAERHRRQVVRHTEALEVLEGEAEAARAALASAEQDLDVVAGELAEAQMWLNLVAGEVATAAVVNAAAFATAQDRYQWAMGLAGLSAPVVVNPGLPIMGEARLSAEQLWVWFVSRSGVFRPQVRELVDLYLEEGELAGVRGDVAFMQAALETGYFRFTGSHNYAGIGHCDSCPKGFDYADEREGVRAQVQLLRFYADASVRTADLGAPPAISWLDDAYAQGCCVTWFGTTGVWATALHYGPSFLAMYEQALVANGLDPRLS